MNVNEIQKFTFRNNNSQNSNNNSSGNTVVSRLGIDLNSTKSKRPVSTQFHESTAVDEIIKPRQLVVDNDDMENKENDSKFYFHLNFKNRD